MPSASTEQQRPPRLKSLLGFLERDPQNPVLIADAAQAAFDEKAYGTASDLILRHPHPLPAALVNLSGLVALSEQRYADAAAVFEALKNTGASDPGLDFNLAWAYAMMSEWQKALDVLDDRALSASPHGPSLKIHLMHHLGLFDEALAKGEELAERFPDDAALMGALATLAMDAEKPDLMRAYAERGAKSAEGNTALAFAALGDHDPRALALFDRALATDPNSPRAWIGKGLGMLASGDAVSGAEAIDRGAAIFGDHVGSWIASGWAHFAAGDRARARQSFERAMEADPNFSECHGGIAVMDFMDGNIEGAQRACDVALRLDKKSFGGALAKVLLLDKSGNKQAAQRVRDIAFAMPLGMHGETLAQLLAKAGGKLSR